MQANVEDEDFAEAMKGKVWNTRNRAETIENCWREINQNETGDFMQLHKAYASSNF